MEMLNNKKFLSGALVVIILALAGIAYWQFTKNTGEIQNSAGGVNTETNNNENSDENSGDSLNGIDIKIDSEESKEKGFFICVDKCGDGICQETDPKCGEEEDANCICQETFEECPQDCSQPNI